VNTVSAGQALVTARPDWPRAVLGFVGSTALVVLLMIIVAS
jgi:hypothetical protein